MSDITKQEVLTFVFNYFSEKLPSVFDNYYETFSNIHSINTRNANHLIRKIRRKTDIGANSIKIKGSDLWNNLNNDIKASLNTKQFRNKYKWCTLPYNAAI